MSVEQPLQSTLLSVLPWNAGAPVQPALQWLPRAAGPLDTGHSALPVTLGHLCCGAALFVSLYLSGWCSSLCRARCLGPHHLEKEVHQCNRPCNGCHVLLAYLILVM
jgi:hypothetical protein